MNCSDCRASLIQQRTWIGATPQQRADWTFGGHRMLKGHGRCGNCYQKAYLRHELPTLLIRRATTTTCARCGIKGGTDICADCLDVVADLGETGRWVA